MGQKAKDMKALMSELAECQPKSLPKPKEKIHKEVRQQALLSIQEKKQETFLSKMVKKVTKRIHFKKAQ